MDCYVQLFCWIINFANSFLSQSHLSVAGKDTGNFTKMYPLDKVVVGGSSVTFCCMYKAEDTFININYGNWCESEICKGTPLTKWSKSLFVQNVTAAANSGYNAWCKMKKGGTAKFFVTGTVLFVGCKYSFFPPYILWFTYSVWIHVWVNNLGG